MAARRLAPFRAQAALAAGLAAAFVAVVLSGVGTARDRLVFVDVAAFVVPLAGAAACGWRAAQEKGGGARAGWALLGLACASWAIGQAAWAAHVVVLRDAAPFPGVADAGYLGLVPLAAAGLLMFLRGGPALGAHRLRTLLDSAIVAVCVLLMAWAAAIRDAVGATVQDGVGFADLVYLAYPFGDAILATLAFLLLARAPTGQRTTLALLGFGALSLAVADTAYVVQGLKGIFQDGTIVHTGWVAGFLLVALAALHPPGSTEAPSQAASLRAATMPYWPFLMAVGAAAEAMREHGVLEPVLFWLLILAVLLMVARQFAFLTENVRLRRHAEASLAGLQEEKGMRARMTNAVTHDMLNAMSPVRLELHLLRGGTIGPLTKKQDDALAIVGRNTERMGRLAEDLKDSASLEEGHLKLRAADADLAALVRDAAASRQAEAGERGVALRVQADGPAQAHLDAQRVAQVVDNLLSNALKFTPAGGAVEVRLAKGGDRWLVTVADSGRGLHPSEAARLFQPFVQVHQAGEVKERGTGLGLYISRGIAQRHGGDLTVSSDGMGKGSTFTLALPG